MEGIPTIPGAWWMFELVIIVFLIGVGGLIAELILSIKLNKKFGFRIVVLVVAILAWGVVFYGSFVEPKLLFVDEYDIEIDVEDADGNITITVLSDMHLGPYKKEKWAQKVTERLNTIDSDIVLVAGDFISSRADDIEMIDPYGEINHPVYSVTGNHDHKFGDVDYITKKVEETGFVMLRNRSVEITDSDGVSVDIAGIDDIWYSASVTAAFETIDESTLTILLAHNPDVILEQGIESADLVIAGHTHGGQVRLPWIGPVPPLPTILGRKFDEGLFDLDSGGKLFITKGVSETGPRARLFNPPTIDVLHITY